MGAAALIALFHFKEEKTMSNINWIVRIKNKNFWISLIPAVLLLVQVVAAVFGFTLELGELGDKLLAVVNEAANGESAQ